MSSEYDYLIKVVFVGGDGVGKSSVLLKATDNRFSEKYEETISVEFGTRGVEVERKKIKLQIWDTAGKEDFRPITRSYFRGAQVVCAMWDAGAPRAIERLQLWVEEARRGASENAPLVLVRTKKDLDAEKGITPAIVEEQEAQIRTFAGNDVIIVETSAKTGEGIAQFLTSVAQAAYNQIKLKNREDDDHLPGVERVVVPSVQHAAPQIPGRIERMSHSRTVREAHLNQDGLDKDWLKLHLFSVEQNCRTANTIRPKLEGDLDPVDTVKYAPVLELLRELDSDERALKYKLCIFFTPESYSTRIVAERNREVRQVILDVAFRLFNILKENNVNPNPTSEQLYRDLTRDKIPTKVREILENTYPNLRPENQPSLLA